MKLLTFVGVCAITLLLIFTAGCAAVAIGGGTYAAKASKRDDLLPNAEFGDAQAQYELGKTWCCMGPGFDTQTSTQWLCKASRQGHPGAQYELGRIYDGEISRTPAPGQKVVRLARVKKSEVHAIAYYAKAAANGHEEAATRVATRMNNASEEVIREAEALKEDPQSACEYDEVFDLRGGS